MAKAEIKGAGSVLDQPITRTLETNYMPYAMSVIVSRAIPEIDGFKPSHRKLLYTMYKMGLLTGARTKSANVVGQTMHLNPHGDAAIYDTLVRLSKGNETLLHPYVDSKGNFGKAYSRDMAYAASRYTEVKLAQICSEIFRDIDKDTVDFADNYDGTMKEPVLLPAAFPSVLVNANTGIAVGMASSICPFNLSEVCAAAVKLMKDPDADVMSVLRAPDFPGGGYILYDREAMRSVFDTGRGSIRVRSKYTYDRAGNCIDVTEIPPTATAEAIIDKIIELVKGGKIREIADVRDETDLNGLKITIDLKRGTDADRLMDKLFRMTPLEDTFSCNFNVLIGGTPRVMGVKELLSEWTAFRTECVKRRVYFDLDACKKKLHMLKGLGRILLDIDKAVEIVRGSESEAEVVPNLMIGFGIDSEQAEFVAEIKLRHLNREYILERTNETKSLEDRVADLELTLRDRSRVFAIIERELGEIAKKYGQPRKSLILYEYEQSGSAQDEEAEDYPVTLFLTHDGYFKKITPQSLRMSGEQKLKEGDLITRETEASNRSELVFFTDKCSAYKAKASDFDDTKASVLGDYLPAKLGMEDGENVLYMAVTSDYSGYMLFFFENGKAAKVDLGAYSTKQNRRRLVGAFSDKSPLASAYQIGEDCEFVLTSSAGRCLIVHSGAVPPKTTRATQGVNAMKLRPGHRVIKAEPYSEGMFKNPHRYRVKALPGAGAMPAPEDLSGEQLKL
jgi:DNA gyrase subunit A